MGGSSKVRRGPDGRFVAAAKADGRGDPEMELKRARGDRAGGRPQIRRKHRGALTPAEIEAFLATLAETCNIAHSARTAGRHERVFRDLKKRDPDFAAAWIATLHEAYDLLELEMARRARAGTRKAIYHQGRKVATTRVFNDGMALRLLSLHRKSVERMRAAETAPRRDAKTMFDELAARLAEIKAEEAAKKAGGENGDGGR